MPRLTNRQRRLRTLKKFTHTEVRMFVYTPVLEIDLSGSTKSYLVEDTLACLREDTFSQKLRPLKCCNCWLSVLSGLCVFT